MKLLITLGLLSALTSCANSRIKNENMAGGNATDSVAYPLAVSFTSICCGTASSDFLKSFVQLFNKKNKTNISADIAAGCGREGEFVVLFRMPDKVAAKRKFETELKVLIEKTKVANKKSNSSSGGIALLQDVHTEDFNNCRLGIAPWQLK